MSDNIVQLFRNAAFEPESLHAMGDAYDHARKATPIDVPAEAIARAILNASRTGERSPAKLAEAAIQTLHAEGYSRA